MYVCIFTFVLLAIEYEELNSVHLTFESNVVPLITFFANCKDTRTRSYKLLNTFIY